MLLLLLSCALSSPSSEAQSGTSNPALSSSPSAASPGLDQVPSAEAAVAASVCPPLFPNESPAQGILVQKGARRLGYYEAGKLATYADQPACFEMSLGFTPEGHKQREGDGRTPEGRYHIYTKNPKSQFYVSLGISYPNAADAKAALDAGTIDTATYNRILKNPFWPPSNTGLGGLIFIHGGGVGSDWTWGCVALENEPMKYLFDRVQTGAAVLILP